MRDKLKDAIANFLIGEAERSSAWWTRNGDIFAYDGEFNLDKLAVVIEQLTRTNE